ncbi:uncharacterized protein LOC748549 [Pan troglodytes]|uniref:uncharacterized protein LOC748549 n=1 Tax=Pan troglodytes TaxID=9598 RepID=UPI00020E386E
MRNEHHFKYHFDVINPGLFCYTLLPSQHERKCFCKKELMKRTAKECVTTSPDTAKTFHPCHDKGEKGSRWGGPCLRSEPLVPTRRVSHRTVAKTSPEPRGSEKSRPKAPAEASSLGRTPARAAERSPPPGSQLLQLPLKFAVAAASSRFNPRPPVIGQLLRGKKSTPWQPDKPIKSPAGVTAATLQAGVGWAEEQSGHCAQKFTRKGEMSEMEIAQSCLEAEDSARAHLETPGTPQ